MKRKITLTWQQIIKGIDFDAGTLTIEIPDAAPEPFRVRTWKELSAAFDKQTWKTGERPPLAWGAFTAIHRTRDLAKLARWYLKNDWSMDRFQKFADELDAIAEKDGE